MYIRAQCICAWHGTDAHSSEGPVGEFEVDVLRHHIRDERVDRVVRRRPLGSGLSEDLVEDGLARLGGEEVVKQPAMRAVSSETRLMMDQIRT